MLFNREHARSAKGRSSDISCADPHYRIADRSFAWSDRGMRWQIAFQPCRSDLLAARPAIQPLSSAGRLCSSDFTLRRSLVITSRSLLRLFSTHLRGPHFEGCNCQEGFPGCTSEFRFSDRRTPVQDGVPEFPIPSPDLQAGHPELQTPDAACKPALVHRGFRGWQLSGPFSESSEAFTKPFGSLAPPPGSRQLVRALRAFAVTALQLRRRKGRKGPRQFFARFAPLRSLLFHRASR